MVSPEKLRMILVFVSMGCGSSMEGYIFGHTSTLVAGLYEEKKQLQLTDEDISWITSIIFTSMVIGTMISTFVTERFGRRLTIAFFHTPIVIHWILLYYTSDRNVLLGVRFLVGLCFGGAMPIVLMASAEYSSPKVRGIFLTAITSLSPSVGAALGSYISLATHWRTGALVAIIPAVLASVLPLFCVESPQWLASRGRFEDCAKAFRALHGQKPSSERELQLIFEVEKSKFSKSETKTQAAVLLMKRLKAAGAKRYFWNILLLSLVIQILKTISGKILGAMFGITMLQYMTGQSNVLVHSMVNGAFHFVGCGLSPWISKKFNIRTIIFSGGIVNNLSLVVLSVILYISSANGVLFPWSNVLIYSFQGFMLSATINPILEMVPAELYPLEIKSACVSIIGIIISIFMFVYIKILPGLFVQINYYGVFLLHVLVMSICLLFLWIKLPETKGRTLQEIELFFKNNKFLDIDDLLDAKNNIELLGSPEDKKVTDDDV